MAPSTHRRLYQIWAGVFTYLCGVAPSGACCQLLQARAEDRHRQAGRRRNGIAEPQSTQENLAATGAGGEKTHSCRNASRNVDALTKLGAASGSGVMWRHLHPTNADTPEIPARSGGSTKETGAQEGDRITRINGSGGVGSRELILPAGCWAPHENGRAFHIAKSHRRGGRLPPALGLLTCIRGLSAIWYGVRDGRRCRRRGSAPEGCSLLTAASHRVSLLPWCETSAEGQSVPDRIVPTGTRRQTRPTR